MRSFASVDVHGLQLAALDLVQHGLSGHAEGFGGIVETKPAVGCLGLDFVAESSVDTDAPRRCGSDLFGGDKAITDPPVEGGLADSEEPLGFGDGDHDGIIVVGSDIGLGGRLVDGDGVVGAQDRHAGPGKRQPGSGAAPLFGQDRRNRLVVVALSESSYQGDGVFIGDAQAEGVQIQPTLKGQSSPDAETAGRTIHAPLTPLDHTARSRQNL